MKDHAKVERLSTLAPEEGQQGIVNLVHCADGLVVRARSVVFACGPWAQPVLRDILNIDVRLTVWQTTVMYFKAKAVARHPENVEFLRRAPVFIDYRETAAWTSQIVLKDDADNEAAAAAAAVAGGKSGTQATAEEVDSDDDGLPLPAFEPGSAEDPDAALIYSCSSVEFKDLIKIAVHLGRKVTPESRTFVPDYKLSVKPVKKWMRQHAPFLDERPVSSATCCYTMSADEDFIIDRHPRNPSVVVVAAGSGHAFKLATMIGDASARLAAGEDATAASFPYDLSAFRLDRPALQMKLVD
jgi:glycine/D-amino acid oxidase-like deaminating enzyme